MGALDGDAVHPAARHADHPDPEELARDLQALADEAKAVASDETLKARWQDRLRALASRCEWIEDASARSALNKRVEELWSAMPQA